MIDPWTEQRPPWQPIEDEPGGFMCIIHGMKAGECPCPTVDEYAAMGVSPYDDPTGKVMVKLAGWLAKQKANAE